METVQQNGRFTLFSSKFLSIYILFSLQNPILLNILCLEWKNWSETFKRSSWDSQELYYPREIKSIEQIYLDLTTPIEMLVTCDAE